MGGQGSLKHVGIEGRPTSRRAAVAQTAETVHADRKVSEKFEMLTPPPNSPVAAQGSMESPAHS